MEPAYGGLSFRYTPVPLLTGGSRYPKMCYAKEKAAYRSHDVTYRNGRSCRMTRA